MFSNNLPDAGTADADFIPFAFTPNANGSFGLDESILAALNGGSLPDGAYTLHVRSQDANGKWSAIASVAFTLDTTAPGLNIVDLIDGIAWIEGVDRLKGQVNSFDLGTTATYQFDAQASTPLALNSVGAFDLLLDLPDAVGSHTLSIRTTDLAGNFQTIEYRFLIADLQPAVDDDQWVAPNPPTSGGGGSGSGGGAASWLGAGGGGGGYQWGNGGFLPGGNDPWGDNHANPYPGGGGTGYGSDDLPSYLEKMAIILDQAVGAIGTGSATVHQKAALYNRLSVLMEVADMVDQGGFYDRMAAVMFGIFNEAENDPIVTAGDAQAEGYVLATDLVNGTDAVRVQVFQTALLAVVNQVLIDRGVVATTANRAEFEGMVSALLALGRTYASLNPTLASDTATTTTPDFLDSLWRAQQPLNPTTAKPTAEIHGELARGMAALSSLLAGVNNPIQALTFVNNLIQAATQVDVLKDDIHDAKFLRELVEFGFEVAKVNPAIIEGDDQQSANWIENLLEGGNLKKAQGGLSFFLNGAQTLNDRLQTLEYTTRLIQVAAIEGDLVFKQAKGLSYLANLGGSYAGLRLNQSGNMQDENLFLSTVLWHTDAPSLARAKDELSTFVNNQTDIYSFLDFQSKLLYGLTKISDTENLLINSEDFVYKIMDWGTEYYLDVKDQNGELLTHDPMELFQSILEAPGYQEAALTTKNSIKDLKEVKPLSVDEELIINRMIILANQVRRDTITTVQLRQQFANSIDASRNDLFKAFRAYSNIFDEPTRLRALRWGLTQWVESPSTYANTVYIPNFGLDVREFYGSPENPVSTCNRFVGDAYAIGGGVGYGVEGEWGTFPTGRPLLIDPRPGYPVDANELSSTKPAIGVLTNLPLTINPKLGDIISFQDSVEGHTGLLLGNGIYLSARRGESLGGQVSDGVMITRIPFERYTGQYKIVYRAFSPSS